MAFYTRTDLGRLYVIRMVLPDNTVVHKVGMCKSARATDRLMEILRSWFCSFRFVPYSELKLDMPCDNPKELEKYVHTILAPNRFEPAHKVDGGTEMFIDVDEKRLLWFLRAFTNSVYEKPPELDTKRISNICNLLTV